MGQYGAVISRGPGGANFPGAIDPLGFSGVSFQSTFGLQMRIWKANAMVPGKALPGEEARRRAVEGNTKAGVPVAMRIAPKP